ncbi:hypothetical protein VI817_005163 [Penicillium citrinum]|nr:hypothetical protein VI817_005163 [Penicillium citrinum]
MHFGPSMSLSGRPAIAAQVEVESDDLIYTNKDTVTGKIILVALSSVLISNVSLTLSGSSTSRLRSRYSNETHKVFKSTRWIISPDEVPQHSIVRKRTMRAGRHIFEFSIPFPPTCECAQSSQIKRSKPLPCTIKKRWRKGKTHLLRRLPPSTGQVGSAAEVRYTLDVKIMGRGIPQIYRNLVEYY